MLISKSEFLKDNNLHKPVGRVQFVVFEKFTSAYLQQIAREFMCYLLIIYMKTQYRELRRTNFWQRARAICNLHLCYIKNALVSN